MTLNVAEIDAATVSGAEPGYSTPDAAQPPISRTFFRQAMFDTFVRPGARLGAAWIALLVIGAVFAPFIASSFPIILKTNGHWSSPLFRNLAPADVVLVVGFLFAAALLISRRVQFGAAVGCVLWICAIVWPMTLLPSIVHDGWLPGAEKMGHAFGVAMLTLFGVLDFAALILLPLLVPTNSSTKLATAGFGVLMVIGLLVLRVNPPQSVVYQQYREMQTAGATQVIVRTIVPFSPNDYQRDDPDARVKPPSWHHWMGTEASGADVFSRMVHASRIALSIGFISTGISVFLGVLIGGLMGYYAGTLDIIGMRFIEMIEAVPTLVLLLTVCAFFGRNLYIMMVVIGLFSWTGNARFIRGEFFRLRNQDFVHAAVAVGLPLRSVIFKHMLPNGITPVLVNTSFGVASAILLESTLSFLGLGLVDEPSWGQLLNQARAGGTAFSWWIATFPGLAIFLTVFAYNLIGEAMRDALDPKLRKRE